ncbi:unnamed protein product [Gongylonema pulchrum]|uniref:Uncharacterized protein n=1 Tax=Gongylonema pulchrum TaxID=637853 RepID=A0A183D1R2_9BILA|nr:unnamed protein product [Gongylonema pulchrum]
MRSLVPDEADWTDYKKRLRTARWKCTKTDMGIDYCSRAMMGCYRFRYGNAFEHRFVSHLPSGCISNIDQKKLEKFPYLALCTKLKKDGFARKCFDTGERNKQSRAPLILCCCNLNEYDDCPIQATVPEIGYFLNITH